MKKYNYTYKGPVFLGTKIGISEWEGKTVADSAMHAIWELEKTFLKKKNPDFIHGSELYLSLKYLKRGKAVS